MSQRRRRLFLYYVPAVCVAMQVLVRRDVTVRSVVWSLCYGEVAAALCVAMIAGVERLQDRLLARRGHPAPDRSLADTLKLAVACLVPAVLVTNLLESFVAPALSLDYQPATLRDLVVSSVIGLAVLSGFFLMQLRERELAWERSERERLAAQLAALTAQLPPHFLFNALNAIVALVHERPAAAEDAIVALAELSGAALRATKDDAHTLGEELKLCRAYLALEAVRFGPRLAAAIDAGDEALLATTRVPVLLLQTLLENAVRHGFVNAPEDAHLSLTVRRQAASVLIEIADDGVGMPAGGPRAGTGLEGSIRRLRLLFGARARLDVAPGVPRGTIVRVTLPGGAV